MRVVLYVFHSMLIFIFIGKCTLVCERLCSSLYSRECMDIAFVFGLFIFPFISAGWFTKYVLYFFMFDILGDAQSHTWLGHSRNVTDLILLGFIQAWFVEIVDTPGRWRCIANTVWFFPLFFTSIVGFSVLTSLPGFDESFNDDSVGSLLFIIVLSISTLAVIVGIGWHILYAKRTLRTNTDFLGFMLFRVATLCALSIAYYIVHNESTIDGLAKFHLHHYFVAWLISLFAAFNHRISIAFLAVTTGIFVQGIGAYSAASMFYRGDTTCPELAYI